MSTIIITVDTKEPNQLLASTVRAMRRSLDVSAAALARASGIARHSIEAIEAGGTTTPAQRHHITVALGSLSNNRATQALPSTTPGDDGAWLPGAAVAATPTRRRVKAPALAGQ